MREFAKQWKDVCINWVIHVAALCSQCAHSIGALQEIARKTTLLSGSYRLYFYTRIQVILSQVKYILNDLLENKHWVITLRRTSQLWGLPSEGAWEANHTKRSSLLESWQCGMVITCGKSAICIVLVATWNEVEAGGKMVAAAPRGLPMSAESWLSHH